MRFKTLLTEGDARVRFYREGFGHALRYVTDASLPQ